MLARCSATESAARRQRKADILHGWDEDSKPIKEASGRAFERRSARDKHDSMRAQREARDRRKQQGASTAALRFAMRLRHARGADPHATTEEVVQVELMSHSG